MGCTIHFRGSLNQLAELPKFVDELDDIAQAMDWESHRIPIDDGNTEFSGIILSPGDDCESLPFLFDRSGRLRSLAVLIVEQLGPDPQYSYSVAVKTQFAALKTHIWIVGLLRYLKKKYLADLTVTDEGGFWEAGNVEDLIEHRRFLQNKIDLLGESLSDLNEIPDDLESLVTEIERIVDESQSNTPKDQASPEG